MKKIFFSIMAVAALAACTKSEPVYEPAGEIGFQVVSGKMTKAAVTTTTYPEDLHMYVFAMTEVDTTPVGQTEKTYAPNTTADYLKNAEFAKVSVSTDSKNLWGGWENNAAKPYYWPNVTPLFFAGVSKSGNVNNGATLAYSNGVITVDGYVSAPGTATLGDNDLMWFPVTSESYDKADEYVPVTMKHACSWLTIKLVGDGYTAGKYKVTDIHIEGLTTKGTATLGATASWDLSDEATDQNKVFTIFRGSKELPAAATAEGFESIVNNTIVLPGQVPGTLSISYKFETQAGIELTETVTGSLKFNGDATWAPGTHYTYTVTIGANQILIAPVVENWAESGDHTVTVQ